MNGTSLTFPGEHIARAIEPNQGLTKILLSELSRLELTGTTP